MNFKPALTLLASLPGLNRLRLQNRRSTRLGHEIKHGGYRIIVRRDGPTVRLYGRNAFDWTVRLAAIAAGAELIKAKSFTIDGEAVVWDLTVCHGSRSCLV